MALELFFRIGLRLPTRDRLSFATTGHHHDRNRLGNLVEITVVRFTGPGPNHQIDRTLGGVNDARFNFDYVAHVNTVIELHATSENSHRGFAGPTRGTHICSLIEPTHQGTAL